MDAFSSKRILIKTWVDELTPQDEQKIEKWWQPTSARYISPEEKELQEVQEKLRVEKELVEKLN